MELRDHLEEFKPYYIIGAVITAIIGGVLYYEFGPHSRRTLNPAGKVLEYEFPVDYKRIINVSSGGTEGDIMLTYENLEGKIITKEYNRMGLFETTIKWKEQENNLEKDN